LENADCVSKDRMQALRLWPILRDANLRFAPQDEDFLYVSDHSFIGLTSAARVSNLKGDQVSMAAISPASGSISSLSLLRR
jgi:hypothetical protein